jgi:uncharacterized protein (TIGR02996 family)
MRTFVLHQAKGLASRFWNIDLQDDRCVITSGALYRRGQTRIRQYSNANQAKIAHDRLIDRKLAAGYVETTPVPVPPLQKVLEAALVANPDDLAAHMAYADFLSEQGDPRGELIQAQIALEQLPRHSPQRVVLRQRFAALAVEHGRTLLGDLAAHFLEQSHTHAVPFQFRFGWIDILYVDRLTVSLARLIARAPEVRLLSTLRLDDVAIESPGEYQRGDDTPPGHARPSLFALFAATNLTNLRWLEVRAQNLSRDELAAILTASHLPRLTHLGLRDGAFGRNGCRVLLDSGILQRVKVLDLQHCNLWDEQARMLASADLSHLELLILDNNHLTQAAIHNLRATGVPLQATPQPFSAYDFSAHENDPFDGDMG